jgi:hypothetical protein
MDWNPCSELGMAHVEMEHGTLAVRFGAALSSDQPTTNFRRPYEDLGMEQTQFFSDVK